MRAGSEYPPFNVRAEVLYLCLFHCTLINLLPVACCTVGVLPALPLRGPHQGSVQKIMPGVSLQQCCCYLGGGSVSSSLLQFPWKNRVYWLLLRLR